MLKVALINDEKNARDILRLLLDRLDEEIEIIFEADSVQSAQQQLQQTEPDLLLLDLMLSDGTGFDLLEYFPEKKLKVIFTTAYDQFALRAFSYHALDYLLKPINPSALWDAIQYATQLNDLNQKSEQLAALQQSYTSKTLTRLFVPNTDGFDVIKIADIIHLQADGNYTKIFTKKEKLITTKSIKHFADILPTEQFFRVHQSHIVKLDAITAFFRSEGDQIKLSNGKMIPLARRRRNELLNLLKQP